MTVAQMLLEYILEIKGAGGELPDFEGDPEAMQIAKLDDAWRKALKG